MIKNNLPIILLITFLDYLSVSVFYGTSIPLILAHDSVFVFATSAIAKSTIYGLTLLILPLGHFFIAPWWGQLADRFGRRKILLLTLLGSACGYLLMAIAIGAAVFSVFIIGRMLTAITAVNMALGQASLADISQAKNKTSRFNLQFIMISLGFFIGPYLIHFSTDNIVYARVFYVLAAGYLIATLWLITRFQETLTDKKVAQRSWVLNLRQLFAVLQQPQLKTVFIVWLVFQTGWSLFFQFSGEFLYEYRHMANEQINMIFSWLGVGALLVQVFLVQPLAQKIAPQKIVPWAIFLMGSCLILMGLVPVKLSFFVLLAGYCIGIGFFLTNMNAYVSNLAQANHQGQIMTLLSSTIHCLY